MQRVPWPTDQLQEPGPTNTYINTTKSQRLNKIIVKHPYAIGLHSYHQKANQPPEINQSKASPAKAWDGKL